jgi:hypothetical protein
LENLNFQRSAHADRFQRCLCHRQQVIKQDFQTRGFFYGHGVEFSAPSSVLLAIHPHYGRFVALVGIDDSLWNRRRPCFFVAQSALIFRVFIDGKLVAESPIMRLYQEPWRFDVVLPMASRRLILSMMDPWPRNLINYGSWLNAGFRLRIGQNLFDQKASLGRSQPSETR